MAVNEMDDATARDAAADAKLALIHRTVVDGFLTEYGTSTLATFKVAVDLASSVRKILYGSGVAAREAIAAAERERLLAELASRKVAVFGELAIGKPPETIQMVPWAALLDLLAGLPTVGFEQVPGEPEETSAPPVPGTDVAAERERIYTALAARRETLTRPGWGPRAPRNVDVVPWEAVAEVLGGKTAAATDSEALAHVRQLAKTWAGLPPDTAASLTLRHAGAELLGRIAGESEPER